MHSKSTPKVESSCSSALTILDSQAAFQPKPYFPWQEVKLPTPAAQMCTWPSQHKSGLYARVPGVSWVCIADSLKETYKLTHEARERLAVVSIWSLGIFSLQMSDPMRLQTPVLVPKGNSPSG